MNIEEQNLNELQKPQLNIGAVIGSFNWTSEEVAKLKDLGYFVYSDEKYPSASKGDYRIEKDLLYKKVSYNLGTEGTAMDCDGDWGWCRSWRRYETLDDALKNCR